MLRIRTSHWPMIALLLGMTLGSSPASAAYEESKQDDANHPDSGRSLPSPSAQSETAQRRAKGPLFVQTELRGFEIDPKLVGEALATELGLPLTLDEQAATVYVQVIADASSDVSVTFRDQNNPAQVRRVRAPTRADEVPELAALITGNLARDYSELLIAQMQKTTSGTATPVADADAAIEAKPATGAVEATAVNEPAPPLQPNPFNLAFFSPIAIFPDAEAHEFNADLGLLYSHIGGLSGVGVSGLVSRVNQDASGFLVSGLLQLQHASVNGASIAGAVNIAQGEEVTGLQVAGAVNVAAKSARAVLVAGAVGLAQQLEGVQVAGAVNTASEVTGLQLAGALNTGGKVDGAQIGGAVNIADEGLLGFQLSSINLAQSVSGAQVGIINIGGEVDGLQLGIVNVAKNVDGASIGLVTYSQEGRTQLVTWYNTTQPLNVGARFYTGPLYAMPTVGYDPSEPESLHPGFSLGARVWADRVFVDLEANYQNRLLTGAGDSEVKFDEHDIELRYRLLVGYELLPWLGAFVGGGALHAIRTQDPVTQEAKPEFTVGIQFF